MPREIKADVPAVVEEFYPQEVHPMDAGAVRDVPATTLRGKLDGQVTRLASA